MLSAPLREVAKAKKRADWTRAAFEGSIIAAHAEGHSTRAIAEVCGLSHQRVWQILHGR
jgi:hypothetical protein